MTMVYSYNATFAIYSILLLMTRIYATSSICLIIAQKREFQCHN